MNKIFAKILGCLTAFSLVLGISTIDATAATKTNWKNIYKKVLEDNYYDGEKHTYKLIYVNNDSIPELVVETDYGMSIYTAYGTNYDVLNGGNREKFSYKKKGNMILDQEESILSGSNWIFKIKNGKFVCVWKGNHEYASETKEIYACDINGKSVSVHVYKEKVNSYKKQCALRFENVKSYSYKEIREKLNNSTTSAKTSKLSNGRYFTYHIGDSDSWEYDMAYCKRARIKDGKLTIWGSLDKYSSNNKVVSTKKYAKRVLSMSKNCKVCGTGDDNGKTIEEKMPKSEFNRIFDNTRSTINFMITVKNNKVTKILVLS